MKRILVLIGLLLFAPLVSAINISDCYNISASGNYVLTSDIINTTNLTSNYACMDISASNVVLDCNYHLIDGVNQTYSTGIFSYGNSNVTIKNCIVKDFQYGIYFYYSGNSSLLNSHASTDRTDAYGAFFGITSAYSNNLLIDNATADNNRNGIVLFGSLNNIINNSKAENNLYDGITLWRSNYTKISNVDASGNHIGIYTTNSENNSYENIRSYENAGRNLTHFGVYESIGICFEYSSNNRVNHSFFYGNDIGIFMHLSSGNLIFNNYFRNAKNACFYNLTLDECVTENQLENYWNVTRQRGKRVYAQGNEIGGNYWSGFSCYDNNFDGFCDNRNFLAENNVDYLPLSTNYVQKASELLPLLRVSAIIILPAAFILFLIRALFAERSSLAEIMVGIIIIITIISIAISLV